MLYIFIEFIWGLISPSLLLYLLSLSLLSFPSFSFNLVTDKKIDFSLSYSLYLLDSFLCLRQFFYILNIFTFISSFFLYHIFFPFLVSCLLCRLSFVKPESSSRISNPFCIDHKWSFPLQIRSDRIAPIKFSQRIKKVQLRCFSFVGCHCMSVDRITDISFIFSLFFIL